MPSLASLENILLLKHQGGKQIIFPSDYVPSAVQEPDTYENWMHTDFIIPIHPISHCDDGSNIIFDIYHTFKGEVSCGWVCISMTQKQPMISAPKVSRWLVEWLIQRALLQPHGPLHITLKLALTGRQFLTYKFVIDPRLSTITMKFNMSGMTSQAIFHSGASQSGTR